MYNNLVFITPIIPGSGNVATAARIIHGLKNCFKNIYLENSRNYKTYDQLKNKIMSDNENVNIDLIMCVHAYHSGRLFYENNEDDSGINLPPIITIFGGTDVHSANNDWLPIIKNTISLSKYLICFSENLMQIAVTTYPCCTHKCLIIPQGVCVNPRQDFQLTTYLKDDHFYSQNFKIVSWLGAIRKVKDPLFIENILNDIYLIDDKILFIYAGYSLDDSLAENLKNLQLNNRNFYFINGLSSCDAHSFLSQSWALINTSINEGMSLSILEAMKLEIPVIVRKNFGNCSLVEHKFNGLIFESKEDFIGNLKILLNDDMLRQKMIINASEYVSKRHSCELESKSYYNCIMKALDFSSNVD